MFHGMPRQQLLLLLGLAATGGVDAARVRGDSSLNAGANMKPAMTLKGQHNSAVRNSLAKLLDGGLKSPGGGDDDDAAALLIHELMSKSGGSSSPQNMEDMIPQLLPILQGMENSTKRAHVSAQNHINSVHGRFALCHPDSNSSLSTYLSTYQSTLSSHTTCRGNEFTLQNDYTTCTQTKNNHKIAMDDKKTLFDDVNFDPTPTSDCQSPTSEGRGDYLLRLKNFFDSEYTKWSTRKHNWQIAYWTYGNLTCTDKQTSLTSKKAECDGYLRSIESNACSYAQGVKTACNSYDTCWNEAEAAYNNAKQATQEEEAAFKVHWRGVQRMKCVLTALGNGSATTADASVLEGCIAVTLYNTSHLDVTYPATPAKASCNDPTEYPCTAAYTTAVYQSLAPNTPPNVPVCNECVLPGPEAPCLASFVGQDLGGQDVQATQVSGNSDAELDTACCNLCKNDGACEFWVRAAGTGTKDCWLKRQSTRYTTNADRRGGVKAVAFTVSGAAGINEIGDSSSAEPLNGMFFQEGTRNGKPYYVNAQGSEIRWETGSDWGVQNLGTPGAPKWTATANRHHRYYNEESSSTPPGSGWHAR
eukprot:CAMPEP_0179024510 /NCGR_PEP_ID=MMETSP0796-20121207/7489_1 /TAXON_ID=73915 /ORGANISM="Pyrodinium bahamense, Strain pbaha01" /LENGTH=586 /DNA_ID=CAMNT_0020720467 /DNA_START=104 /DNA_END=1860 /DNA_ORIENTATION=-